MSQILILILFLSYDTFIKNLHVRGFSRTSIAWDNFFQNFSRSSQFRWREVLSGVPEGSVLNLTLLDIMLNDLDDAKEYVY